MGARGPKPTTDVERQKALQCLKDEAAEWAGVFYTLRDGQRGMVYYLQAVPGKILGAEIIPKDRRTAEKFIQKLAKVAGHNWVISRPVFPNPRAWEQLKQARTMKEIRQAAGSFHKWTRQTVPWAPFLAAESSRAFQSALRAAMLAEADKLPGWWVEEFPRAIRTHANELLRAKRMRNYPRTDRPRSDDKRIQFFAKVMAGLALRLSPATAMKRLGRWRWPKDWAEKEREEIVRRLPMPKTKSFQQEKQK